MERKKSWSPGQYIPYVVKAGSAKAWNKHHCSTTVGEIFVRSSSQKQWLDSSVYGEVYEEVYVNEARQLVTFLGVTTLPGELHTIHPSQALFHVQHGTAGDEDHPKNTWRIVHLTAQPNHDLIRIFQKMNDPTALPGFIQAYIEHDLHIEIKKK